MNGEKFYDAFKEALNFYNIPWGEKAKLKIKIENESLVFYTNDSCIGMKISLKQITGE